MRIALGAPFCMAGFHLGILSTTLTASSSQPNPIPCSTSMFATLPLTSTSKATTTRPVTCADFALSGYEILFCK